MRAAEWLLALATAAVALLPLSHFVRIALGRLDYPYELEWMEGGVVTHVQVVLAGQSLYRAPSIAFTPFIYAPLYYYVCALFSLVFGVGYFAARLVSFLSILGSFALIGYWVRRETGSVLAGIISVGLFSATYATTGFWFDVARVDSFALVLVLGGYVLCRFGTTPRAAILGGVVLGAACLAKQTALPLALPALVYLGIGDRRRGILALGSFATVGVGLVLAFDVTSHGWFHFYVLRLPMDQAIFWKDFRSVVVAYFWGPVTILALGGLAVLVGVAMRSAREWILYAGCLAVACGTGLASMLHTGGYPNTLLPAYALLAVAAGLSLAALVGAVCVPMARRIGVTVFALVLVLVQTTSVGYDDRAALPSRRDRVVTARVIHALSTLPRPLWVTASSYYSVLAGQKLILSHTMALVDVLKGTNADAARLRANMIELIRSRRFRTIVLDRAAGFLPPDLVAEIWRNYHFTRRLFGRSEQAVWPKSGASIRPDEVWEAN